MFQIKPLKIEKDLNGISKKTNEIHHDKLYVGYVNKANEADEKLGKLREEIISGKASGANATLSELRSLKLAESFAVNGVNLHELYFDLLGGDGDWQKAPELSAAISEKWGSVENFIKYFSECAMATRGWAVLAWDLNEGRLKQYNGDAHDHAVWGCVPVMVLDVYEHAYFIDFGSDRKAYLEALFKNMNWQTAEERFKKLKGFRI